MYMKTNRFFRASYIVFRLFIIDFVHYKQSILWMSLFSLSVQFYLKLVSIWRYTCICFLSKCLIFWQLTKFYYLIPLWGISFPYLSFDILYYWKTECLVKPNFHFRTCLFNTVNYFPKCTNRTSNTSTVKFKKTT